MYQDHYLKIVNDFKRLQRRPSGYGLAMWVDKKVSQIKHLSGNDADTLYNNVLDHLENPNDLSRLADRMCDEEVVNG